MSDMACALRLSRTHLDVHGKPQPLRIRHDYKSGILRYIFALQAELGDLRAVTPRMQELVCM